MKLKSKQWLFTVAATLFILITPILAIYSLGYNFNLEKQELSNTLSINIATLPIRAEVKINNQKTQSSPVSIRTNVGQSFEVEVGKDDFLTERFKIWSSEEENSTARLQDLVLLPEGYTTLEELDTQDKLYFLNSNHLLIVDSEGVFIQVFDVSGFRTREKVELTDFARDIQADIWKETSPSSWWSKKNQLLIYRFEDEYKILDLSQFGSTFENLIYTDLDQLLLQDDNQSLWALDLDNLNISFVRGGVQAIYRSQGLNNAWILSDYKIFRINPNQNFDNPTDFIPLTPYLELDTTRLARELILENEKVQKFEIESGVLGMLIQINENLFYSPDLDPSRILLLSNQVYKFLPEFKSVLYLDTNNFLKSYNFANSRTQTLGQLDLAQEEEIKHLAYYPDWNRITIYTSQSTYGVYYDIKNTSSANILYYPNRWIASSNCSPEIINNSQICIQDQKLVNYKNTNLF